MPQKQHPSKSDKSIGIPIKIGLLSEMGNILLDWLDPDKKFLLVKDSFLAVPTGTFMMCARKRALFLGDFHISKFQICFEAFYNRGRAGEAI